MEETKKKVAQPRLQRKLYIVIGSSVLILILVLLTANWLLTPQRLLKSSSQLFFKQSAHTLNSQIEYKSEYGESTSELTINLKGLTERESGKETLYNTSLQLDGDQHIYASDLGYTEKDDKSYLQFPDLSKEILINNDTQLISLEDLDQNYPLFPQNLADYLMIAKSTVSPKLCIKLLENGKYNLTRDSRFLTYAIKKSSADLAEFENSLGLKGTVKEVECSIIVDRASRSIDSIKMELDQLQLSGEGKQGSVNLNLSVQAEYSETKESVSNSIDPAAAQITYQEYLKRKEPIIGNPRAETTVIIYRDLGAQAAQTQDTPQLFSSIKTDFIDSSKARYLPLGTYVTYGDGEIVPDEGFQLLFCAWEQGHGESVYQHMINKSTELATALLAQQNAQQKSRGDRVKVSPESYIDTMIAVEPGLDGTRFKECYNSKKYQERVVAYLKKYESFRTEAKFKQNHLILIDNSGYFYITELTKLNGYEQVKSRIETALDETDRSTT